MSYLRAITISRCFKIGLALFVVLCVVGLVISCQPTAETPPVPSSGVPLSTPPQIEVAIEGFAFKPAMLNIPVGTTVVWYNNDSTLHTVTARDNSFDSGSLSRDDEFSYTFEQKGTFEYYCTIHPYMEGKVVVD